MRVKVVDIFIENMMSMTIVIDLEENFIMEKKHTIMMDQIIIVNKREG